MGFRSSWVAVEGANLPTLLQRLRWRATGERAEWCDTGLYGIELPGWAVLLGMGWDFREAVTSELAREASAGGEAIFLTQDDTSMTATIAGFREGRERWRVEYDGSSGPGRAVVTGVAPACLAGIVVRCEIEQAAVGGPSADVDCMYEVPPELGRALVGFRHDQDPEGAGPEPYELVEAG